MAPQELTLPGVTQRNRKAALTMAALFVLAVCLSIFFARWYLQDSRQQLLREMGQDMNSQASGKVALLTVWSGMLAEQVDAFVAQDMLRLFAAEVDKTGISAAEMLQLAQQPDDISGLESLSPAGDIVASGNVLKEFAPRIPPMARYLREFTEKNGFYNVCLINTKLEVYLAPEGMQPPSEEQRPFLQKALTSKEPIVMPVRRDNGRLVMDAVFPIFAPLYVDASGERVVSLLFATYNVLSVTAAASGHAGEGRLYNTSILQVFDEKLQRIEPAEKSGLLELPGWSLHDGKLPLGMRMDPSLPEGQRQIYGLALPVPNLPWLVEQTLPVSSIDEKFAASAKTPLRPPAA